MVQLSGSESIKKSQKTEGTRRGQGVNMPGTSGGQKQLRLFEVCETQKENG